MRKILVIASREYQAAVRTKAFVISLVVVPLMMGGSVLVQNLLKGQVDIRPKHFAVIDRTPHGELFGLLEEAARQRNEQPVFVLERIEPSVDTVEAINQQRFELSEWVRKGELFGFLEIGANVYSYGPGTDPLVKDADVLRYQSERPLDRGFSRWAEKVINDAVEERRCAGAGLSVQTVREVERPVPLVPKGLSKRTARGEVKDASGESQLVPFLVPVGLMLLMFMVMMGITPLIQGIVEEKLQRIAEVLLGSVRPMELMMGKLLGAVGVSLTSGGIYLAGTYWAAYHFEFTEYVPLSVLVWFVAFQVLMVLMYGSLFIAIGSACTNMQETQTLLLPVMLLACLPLFVWLNVVQEPNSTFATAFSFFPPATPMLMIARLAVPPGIAWWQPVLGAVLVLATTLLCVYAAGRIFRVGILMQGKGANIGEMIKWVFRG